MKNNITNTFQSLLKVLTVSSLRPARCDGADPGGGGGVTCALGWVKCREHISLLVILCIIVYVTNKAHLSLTIITPSLS